MMMVGAGFPDFFCYSLSEPHEVVFIESKKNKYLTKEEKEQVVWIKENLKIPIEVAFMNKDGDVEYVSA
jgi:hypothetical protein